MGALNAGSTPLRCKDATTEAQASPPPTTNLVWSVTSIRDIWELQVWPTVKRTEIREKRWQFCAAGIMPWFQVRKNLAGFVM